MSEQTLEIFNLGRSLVLLLGEEQAIADLELLHQRHPEMFKSKEEIKELIQKVASEPDIIIKNPRAISEKNYIAAKKLNFEKMGDVGIRNDKGTNVVYHANNKKIEELERLQDKIEKGKVQVVGTPTSYTQAQSLDGLVENNISPVNEIIPQPKVQAKQNPTQSQANFDTNEFNTLSPTERLAQLQRNQESISQIPKASEILKNQESTNDLDSLQRDSKESQHKIRKHQ